MDRLRKTPDTGPDTLALPAHATQVAELFRENNRALIAFLRCRLNSLSDAQELAQDAYLRLLTLKSPEHIDSLRAYLFRIATNLATDRLRTHKVRSDAPPEQAVANFRLSSHPERHVWAVEQVRDLHLALGELPAKTSQAFVMHVLGGWDFHVVAHAMKLSDRMVRYHVSDALAHCRARVDMWEMP